MDTKRMAAGQEFHYQATTIEKTLSFFTTSKDEGSDLSVGRSWVVR